MRDIATLIGRIFIAIFFFFEAYDSIVFAERTKESMTQHGLIWQQQTILIISIVLLILGALSVLVGYRMRIGGILLLLYIIPVTFIVHSWWNDPEMWRRLQSILFMKNLAIIGGVIMLMFGNAGRYSVKSLLANTRVPKRLR